MSTEDTVQGTQGDESGQESEYQKPDPVQNPRNIALAEIAKSAAIKHAQDAAETVDSIDDEGVITPAKPAEPPPAEPAAASAAGDDTVAGAVPPAERSDAAAPSDQPSTEETFDPTKNYKVVVDGVEMEVPGSKIIESGFRTFRKEATADYRLQIASQLLNEAQQRAAQTAAPTGEAQAPTGTPKEPTDSELAHALQFGTAEQSADAIKVLRGRGVQGPEQIRQFVDGMARFAARDEFLFQDAINYVNSEFKDLMGNEHLRRHFFMEENRYRAPRERGGLGDKRPYKELYKDIGEGIRKAFNLQKPAAPASSGTPPSKGTVAGRQERKASSPPVPRTAASRLSAVTEQAKPKTTSEIIAGMAASRGKNRLTQPTRKES